MTTAPPVAVFVDLENVGGASLREIYTYAAGLGRVCHFAVYANWMSGRFAKPWAQLQELGGVPQQILNGGGKNAADIAMTVDCMEYLYQSPAVAVYVLATGDSDFVSLAQRLRSRGKSVWGVATSASSVSQQLVASCDGFWHLPVTTIDPAAAEPPVLRAGPSTQQVRDTLVALLTQTSPQNVSVLGNGLKKAFADFRPKALGQPNLTALLKAQSDLLAFDKQEGRELLVRLVTQVPDATQPATDEPPATTKPTRTRPARRKSEDRLPDPPPVAAPEPEPAESLLMRMQIPLPLLDVEPGREPGPGPEPEPEPGPEPEPDPNARREAAGVRERASRVSRLPQPEPEPEPEPARPLADAVRSKAVGSQRKDATPQVWIALQHGILDTELPAIPWPIVLGLDESDRTERLRAALADAGKPRTALRWLLEAAKWLQGHKPAELSRRVQRTPDLVFDGVPGFGATRARRALAAWQRVAVG